MAIDRPSFVCALTFGHIQRLSQVASADQVFIASVSMYIFSVVFSQTQEQTIQDKLLLMMALYAIEVRATTAPTPNSVPANMMNHRRRLRLRAEAFYEVVNTGR